MDQPEPSDESTLAGRCNFCGIELPDGAAVCPECGHGTGEGLVIGVRRPAWVRVLAWAVLLLAAAGFVAWALTEFGVIG